MLHVLLELTTDGIVVKLHATGHVPGTVGNNLVCAAASAQLREFARWVMANPSIDARGSAVQAGEFHLELALRDGVAKEYFQGACDFLRASLQNLAAENATGLKYVEITETKE